MSDLPPKALTAAAERFFRSYATHCLASDEARAVHPPEGGGVGQERVDRVRLTRPKADADMDAAFFKIGSPARSAAVLCASSVVAIVSWLSRANTDDRRLDRWSECGFTCQTAQQRHPNWRASDALSGPLRNVNGPTKRRRRRRDVTPQQG